MAMSLKDSRKGGKPIRLMCVEKDKEFDELKFMASFRGTIKDFPSSIDQLKERTKAIIKLLDHNLQLQKEELVLSSGVDTGKNKVMAETIQKLSTELDLYQYLYARLCRMEVLESFVATLRPQLSKVLFMEEYCTYLVSFCESSVKLAGEKFKIFRFSGKGKYPMKDYVTTDHLLLLHQSLQSASSLLSLFSLETTTWKTFIFENHSDGLTSPPANVIRRIRSLLSSIGILDSDHGETSQDDYWRLERAYQAGLYEAVGEFLLDPKGMLQKEFLSRLQSDLAALEKGKGKSTQAVSIAEELNQILKWASLHPESLSDSISSAVDTALFEKVEREREIEEEKNAPLSLFEAPAVEVDMSEVIYNHITWDNLNVNQEIGVGGFALVYEAELAGERVAVKKIRDEVKDAKTQLSNEVPTLDLCNSTTQIQTRH